MAVGVAGECPPASMFPLPHPPKTDDPSECCEITRQRSVKLSSPVHDDVTDDDLNDDDVVDDEERFRFDCEELFGTDDEWQLLRLENSLELPASISDDSRQFPLLPFASSLRCDL